MKLRQQIIEDLERITFDYFVELCPRYSCIVAEYRDLSKTYEYRHFYIEDNKFMLNTVVWREYQNGHINLSKHKPMQLKYNQVYEMLRSKHQNELTECQYKLHQKEWKLKTIS